MGTGGAETLVLEMIRNTRREDVSYTVIYLGGSPGLAPKFEAVGADVESLGARTSPPQLDPRAAIRLFNTVRNADYDIVHAHMPYTQVIGRLAESLFGTGAVVSTQHIVRDSLHAAARTFESLTQPLDSATVAVSEGVQTSFTGKSNVYRSSGLDGQWCTIHNGIDVTEFHRTVEEAKRRADGGTGNIELLNVGRYVPEKSQRDLIRAMETVSEQLPNSHLSLVGPGGPLEDDLRAEVDRRGLEDHVTVTGYVPDIHEYYATADVFVSASILEGLPITILEAMASELPVVATRIPGVDEVIRDGQTGYLVPPDEPTSLADSILSLKSESKRRRFGQRSYRQVSTRFSIEQTVESYFNLYDEVLAK